MIRNPVLAHPLRSFHGTCLCLLLLSLFLALATACAWSASAAILDTSFEGKHDTAPAGWATTGKNATWTWDSSIARTGSRSVSIAMSRRSVGWTGPTFDVDSSYSSVYPCYVLTGWVRTEYGVGRNYLSIEWYGPSGLICTTSSRYAPSSTSGKWAKLSVMALPPVGATRGQVVLRSDRNDAAVWFDDVSLVLTELPCIGDKPTANSAEGPQIAPYRALVLDQDGSPLAADALLSLAIQRVNAEKMDQARTELAGLLAKYPAAECVAEARYVLADTAFTQKAADAESLFDAVVENHPNSEFAPLAKMKKAYLHIPKEYSRDATHAEFVNIVSSNPDSPCAMECLYRAAKLQLRDPENFDAAFAEFDYIMKHSADGRLQAESMVDAGLALMHQALEAGPDQQGLAGAFQALLSVRSAYPSQGSAIGRGELRVGRYYLYTSKDVAAGKRVFSDFVKEYPNVPITPWHQFQLAYCSYAEGMYSDAANKYHAFVVDPEMDDGWKAWCGFCEGDAYGKLKDYVSARKCYQSVIDQYPDTDFSKASQHALDVLALREQGKEVAK